MSNSVTITVKPRIKWVRKHVWECRCPDVVRQGISPRQAFNRWMTASIRDQMVALGLVEPNKAQKAAMRAIPSPQWPQEPYKGEVVQVRGVTAHRPLVLPQNVRLAGLRAAQHQPVLHSIATTVHGHAGFKPDGVGL